MKKRLTLFLAGLFLSIGTALAQTTVRGTVVSAQDNEPVIGATVKVVGTNTGAATDVDGKFSVSVPNMNAQLEVSYIGMTTQVVKAAREMRIALESVETQLDEVMVVAFGTQKKSAFTGSAAVMRNCRRRRRPTWPTPS